ERSPRTTCASSRSTSAPRAVPPSPPSRAELARASMKMRQSLAELERAFVDEASLDRNRRASLRRTAEQRTLKREAYRRQRHGSVRSVLPALTLVMPAVIVTVVMFRTLYLLLS